MNEVVSEEEFDNTSAKIVDNSSEGTCLTFKCDQCSYINPTEKGLRQHTRMKHRISQLDGNFDLVEDDSDTTEWLPGERRLANDNFKIGKVQ